MIDPDSAVQLLHALPMSEIDTPELSGPGLAIEAQEALGGNAGIHGPMVRLPRLLVPLALSRNIEHDLRDPDAAVGQVAALNQALGGMYTIFLQEIANSNAIQKIRRVLDDLWGVSPDHLVEFIQSHPELATSDAAIEARVQRESLPEELRNETPPVARLRLIEGLSNGGTVESAVADYLTAIDEFWQGQVLPELDQLRDQLREAPGDPNLIPAARRVLQIVAGHPELERDFDFDLGTRILTQAGVGHGEVDEAVALFERVRELSQEHDGVWFRATGNLAIALDKKLGGDSSEAWEICIGMLREACDPTLRDIDSEAWGTNLTNLAHALCQRPGGPTAEDLTLALESLLLALQVRPVDDNVVNWAFTQLHLGIVFYKRRHPGDLEAAVQHHRSTLEILRSEDDEHLWIAHHYNLANALVELGADSSVEAEEIIRAAITACPGPLFHGLLLRLLANILEDRLGSLAEEVVTLRAEAARQIDPRLEPALHLEVGGQLVVALQELNRWEEAGAQYENSWVAFEALYGAQLTPETRRDVVARNERLGRWAAYTMARAGNMVRAVEILERSRAMELAAAASRDMADLTSLAEVDGQLARRYEDLRKAYREVIGARFSAPENIAVSTSVNNARIVERSLRELTAEIRRIPGFESFLLPLTFNEIACAAQGIPIIYLISAPGGCFVITISHPDEQVGLNGIHIESASSKVLAELVLLNTENGTPGLLLAQLDEYDESVMVGAIAALEKLRPLATVVAKESRRLGTQKFVVVPTGLLGFVPLAALPVDGSEAEVLDDVCLLLVTPSIATYLSSRKRADRHFDYSFVGIADTDPEHPLPGSVAELETISHLFSSVGRVRSSIGDGATYDWFASNTSNASHVHLACHGYSRIEHLQHGALVLGQGTYLGVSELAREIRLDARLVIMSACQSGHYATASAPDEFVGLTAAFLESGAACVISSLWPVSDDGTALLMTRFYENLLRNALDPPEALRGARQWLRKLSEDERRGYLLERPILAQGLRRQQVGAPRVRNWRNHLPYSSPEYWSAFVSYGC
ncbi:CHAT domain-containing protein [Amycolatopsis acidiphila]|uniref:CHAT domain-containing protein n=1 Tax=Amycolatopsis acidiphila TaxID=715473 RepID=UPI001643742E|nr:CHAT domain-containing protein [Amycolatopsis acidiphila]UIJ61861.1 CHAT domain-containing protein [Amycolatopsis acidiphila]